MKTNSLFFSCIFLLLLCVTTFARLILQTRESNAIAVDTLRWTTPQQKTVIYTQSPDTLRSQTNGNVDDYADQPIPPVSKSTPRWLAPLVTLGVVAIWLMFRMLRFYDYRFPQLFSSHSNSLPPSGKSARLFSPI